MSLRTALSPAARRWLVLAIVAVCASAAVLVYALSGGVTGSSAEARITTETPAQVRAAVVARLRAEHLHYLWVACVPSGNRFQGVRVVRCNVDFGEPHIVAYCSVLRGGALLTGQDNPAIPCGHDNAGWSDPVVTYP